MCLIKFPFVWTPKIDPVPFLLSRPELGTYGIHLPLSDMTSSSTAMTSFHQMMVTSKVWDEPKKMNDPTSSGYYRVVIVVPVTGIYA